MSKGAIKKKVLVNPQFLSQFSQVSRLDKNI